MVGNHKLEVRQAEAASLQGSILAECILQDAHLVSELLPVKRIGTKVDRDPIYLSLIGV